MDLYGALETEAVCFEFVLGVDVDEPNTFHMFEQYTSREGFSMHAKSDSYAAWSAFKATDPFSKPATVSYYNTIEPAAE